MAYIQSHQTLGRHRKVLRAAALLAVDRHKLIGHLHALWWWALDNLPPTGEIGDLTDAELAMGAEWPERQAATLVAALVDAGFIDADADGRRLHDWYDYAGRLNEKRAANAERMREARAQHVQRTNGSRAANGATHVHGLEKLREKELREGVSLGERVLPSAREHGLTPIGERLGRLMAPRRPTVAQTRAIEEDWRSELGEERIVAVLDRLIADRPATAQYGALLSALRDAKPARPTRPRNGPVRPRGQSYDAGSAT